MGRETPVARLQDNHPHSDYATHVMCSERQLERTPEEKTWVGKNVTWVHNGSTRHGYVFSLASRAHHIWVHDGNQFHQLNEDRVTRA